METGRTSVVTAPAGAFVSRWAERLLEAGATQPTEDTTRLLSRLTDRLRAALSADPFHAGAGHEVGAALFGSHLTGPETIGVTVACLTERPEALDVDPARARERMPALVGAVVTGYTSALRACTIEELEQQQPEQPLDRRAAAERRDAEARFRAAFAALDVAVAVCDPAGHIIEASSALVELLRHRLPYLRSRTLFQLMEPVDAAVLAHVIQDDLLSGRHRRVRTEARLRHRSGALIPAQLTVSLVRDAAGRPAHLVVTGTAAPGAPAPSLELGESAVAGR